MNIGIIVGSNRPKRNGSKVAAWVEQVAKGVDGITFNILDLKDIDLPFLDEPEVPSLGNYQHESTKKWAKLVEEQDAFIIVTPEYNHGYPAVIKNALDTVYAEWHGKPVGFVGYGVVGATRAVEQLIPIVTQLNMLAMGGQVNLALFSQMDENGNFVPTERDESGLTSLIERITTTVKK